MNSFNISLQYASKENSYSEEGEAVIKASSTGKARRVTTRAYSRNQDVGESFILPSLDPVTGEIVTTANSPVIHVPPHPVTGSSDGVQETMLALLQEQSHSIKRLAQRVESIEDTHTSTTSASIQPTALTSRLSPRGEGFLRENLGTESHRGRDWQSIHYYG